MMFLSILGVLIKLIASGPVDGNLRIYQGEIDSKNQFPFAVALEGARIRLRFCTGSLIADNWVLTAAHCVMYLRPVDIVIRYGEYTKPGNETKLYKKIIRIYMHPSYHYINQELYDIALMFVEKVPINHVNILALDHKTLFGLPVTYAGFGQTDKNIINSNPSTEMMPLQVGEGVVAPCSSGKKRITEDYMRFKHGVMCIAPKCAKKTQQARRGDSGGPLLYDGWLIGVARSVRFTLPITEYTPVSVYLEWIRNTLYSTYE